MQVHSGIRPISLSKSTIMVVGIFVLVILPIVLGFAFFQPIYTFYLRAVAAPKLEKDLGFRGGYVNLGNGHQLYTLVSVDPGGVLGRAGAKAGDVPCRFVHGIESGFLGFLQEERGKRVTLFLCDGKDWSEKRLSFVVPNGAI